MSIENFFTLQTLFPAAQNANAGKGVSAPVQVQGLDFIDLILARVLENMQKQLKEQEQTQGQAISAQAEKTGPLESDNILLDKTPGLNLAELIAANPEIEEEVRNFITTESASLTPGQEIIQTLMLNQKALDDTLKPLTDGIITAEQVENGSPRLMQALLIDTEKDRKDVLNTLQLILNKLEKLSQDKSGAGLALTNLTPEQITRIKAKIETLLEKAQAQQPDTALSASVIKEIKTTEILETSEDKLEEDKEIAAIVLGLIKILPPQAQPEVIVLPRGLVIAPRPLEITTSAAKAATPRANPFSGFMPANDLAATLNSLTVGSEASQQAEGLIEGEEDFTFLLKEFSNKKTGGAEIQIAQNQPGVKPDASALVNLPLASDGALLAYFESWNDLQSSPMAALSITGPAAMTAAITHAPFAGAAHPATQLVALTIQKQAADGQNKNFILQMEPPELGRVEVRLSFGKDKTVKGVVLTERAETLALLQRDAHTLERALQSAGLDADGSSLSFELADDGHFGHDGGHDGSGNGYAGADMNEGEIIESTMNWYVDEATGHMRFDILA